MTPFPWSYFFPESSTLPASKFGSAPRASSHATTSWCSLATAAHSGTCDPQPSGAKPASFTHAPADTAAAADPTSPLKHATTSRSAGDDDDSESDSDGLLDPDARSRDRQCVRLSTVTKDVTLQNGATPLFHRSD